MESLKFFDCSCSIGMRGIVYPGSFYKINDLVEKMNRYGIEKALVYHSMAREYNPCEGNRMLVDEIKGFPLLVPVWVVMPHNTGEFPKPDELLRQMKHEGVKAVRIFPSATDQNYCISQWNCGELFLALQKAKVPLIIGIDQLSWNELHDLCNSYPGLNIVLTSVNYRVDRNLYSLLGKFRNLFIETIGYKVHSGIEEICTKFGAERLIFGSSMPLYSGAAAVSMINYACISDEEKSLIACRNLEILLEGVQL